MGGMEGLAGRGTPHSKTQRRIAGCDLETSWPEHEIKNIGNKAREIVKPVK